jgi:predicted RNase H-like HicB family nuclease
MAGVTFGITGSHSHYKHPSKPNVVTIPGHPDDDVPSAVIFEQAEHNWAAYAPDLPGCTTTGSTLEETEQNIREAIEGHLRTLSEFGDPIPHPTTVKREIEIQPAA